jgi:hypothetical protein
MKNLIGKKVRGFKFDSRDHCVWFVTLEEYIGRVGVIDQYLDMVNVFIVKYGEDCLLYPAELIEQHIVEDSVSDTNEAIISAILDAYFNGTNLPQISESIREAYERIEEMVSRQLVDIQIEIRKL